MTYGDLKIGDAFTLNGHVLARVEASSAAEVAIVATWISPKPHGAPRLFLIDEKTEVQQWKD